MRAPGVFGELQNGLNTFGRWRNDEARPDVHIRLARLWLETAVIALLFTIGTLLIGLLLGKGILARCFLPRNLYPSSSL